MKKFVRTKGAHFLRKGRSLTHILKNPTETVKMFGQLTKQQFKSNPFIKVLLKGKDSDPTKYAEAFKRMSESELPSMATLRTLGKTLKIEDPEKIIDMAINNPKAIEKHIAQLSNKGKEELRVSIESDTNEAPLSSS